MFTKEQQELYEIMNPVAQKLIDAEYHSDDCGIGGVQDINVTPLNAVTMTWACGTCPVIITLSKRRAEELKVIE